MSSSLQSPDPSRRPTLIAVGKYSSIDFYDPFTLVPTHQLDVTAQPPARFWKTIEIRRTSNFHLLASSNYRLPQPFGIRVLWLNPPAEAMPEGGHQHQHHPPPRLCGIKNSTLLGHTLDPRGMCSLDSLVPNPSSHFCRFVSGAMDGTCRVWEWDTTEKRGVCSSVIDFTSDIDVNGIVDVIRIQHGHGGGGGGGGGEVGEASNAGSEILGGGSGDFCLRVADVERSRVTQTMGSHSGIVEQICSLPSNPSNCFGSVGRDRVVCIWDRRAAIPLQHKFNAKRLAITVNVLKSRPWIFFVGAGSDVQVWDIRAGQRGLLCKSNVHRNFFIRRIERLGEEGEEDEKGGSRFLFASCGDRSIVRWEFCPGGGSGEEMIKMRQRVRASGPTKGLLWLSQGAPPQNQKLLEEVGAVEQLDEDSSVTQGSSSVPSGAAPGVSGALNDTVPPKPKRKRIRKRRGRRRKRGTRGKGRRIRKKNQNQTKTQLSDPGFVRCSEQVGRWFRNFHKVNRRLDAVARKMADLQVEIEEKWGVAAEAHVAIEGDGDVAEENEEEGEVATEEKETVEEVEGEFGIITLPRLAPEQQGVLDAAVAALLCRLRELDSESQERRRLVIGLRETFLKLASGVKLIVHATDVRIPVRKSAVRRRLQQLRDQCESMGVPYVFALPQRDLALCVAGMPIKVTTVAILDVSGAEMEFGSVLNARRESE